MPEGIDLEQKKREEARWRMMRVIDAGRPIAVSEQIIWRVLADIKLTPSLITVRRELAYLRDLGLLEIEGEGTETWFAKLTASGVDAIRLGVTHVGVNNTEGTLFNAAVLASTSVEVALTRPFGGLIPARR